MIPRTREFRNGGFVVRADVLKTKNTRSQTHRGTFYSARHYEAISENQGHTVGNSRNTK